MARDVTISSITTFVVRILVSHVCLEAWTFSVSSSSSSYVDVWGPWSGWSSCGVDCGSGLQDRSRSCLQRGTCPAGLEIQTRVCQNQACPPSQPTFRQKACSRYDRRTFSGKQYTWEPFTHPTDPCKLSCRAKGVHFYANLASRVRDGEPCQTTRHSKAVCFRGVCKPVGCDDILLSPARKDKCGVCLGDGSECQTVAGIFISNQKPRGINNVINIPAGSTSINITELSPSDNFLILQSASGKMYLNAGHGRPTSGSIRAAGTTFQYTGKTSVHPKESIVANGPTNVTVHVKVLLRGRNPGIAYTYSFPKDNKGYSALEGAAPVKNIVSVKTAPSYVEDNTMSQTRPMSSQWSQNQELRTRKETMTTNNRIDNEMSSNSASSFPEVITTVGSILSQGEGRQVLSDQENSSARSEENGDITRGSDNTQGTKYPTPSSTHIAYSVELPGQPDTDVIESSGEVDAETVSLGKATRNVHLSSEDGAKRGGFSDSKVVIEEGSDDGYVISIVDDDDDDSGEDDSSSDEDSDEYDDSDEDSDYDSDEDSYEDSDEESNEDSDEIDDEGEEYEYGGYSDAREEEEANTQFDGDNSNADKRNRFLASSTLTSPSPNLIPWNRNNKEFKIPKFSKSFTFPSKHKDLYSRRGGSSMARKKGRNPSIMESNESDRNSRERLRVTHSSTASSRRGQKPGRRIRIGERVHSRKDIREFTPRALESPSTEVRPKDYFVSENTISRERQAIIDERNRAFQTRREAYNRRLRDHRERVLERRREEAQRRVPTVDTGGHGRSRYDNTRGNVRPGNINAEVKVSPSSPLSPYSSVEKSVHIVPTGGGGHRVVEGQSVIKRVSSPYSRTAINQEATSEFSGEARENTIDVIPRIRPSKQSDGYKPSSGKTIVPRKDSFNLNSQSPPKKILPRISENQRQIGRPGSEPRREIIPRITGTETQTHSSTRQRNNIPSGFGDEEREQISTSMGRRRITIPKAPQPDYVPNERSSLVSAFGDDGIPEGGDTASQAALRNDIIPNTVDAGDYDPSLAYQRPSGKTSRLKIWSSAEGGSDFSNNEWRISGLTECTHSCGGGVQQTVVVCVDTGTQAVVTDDNCRLIQKPEVKAVTCNKRPCPAQWVPSPWTQCSVSCGDGEQIRTVTCQARVSPTLNLTMPESRCQHSKSPVERRHCNLEPCSSWSVGDWSRCSADCGDGVKSRSIQCQGLNQQLLDDTECKDEKPKAQEKCNMGECGKGWFFTEWPEKCPVECGTGVLSRKVFCASQDGEAIPESRCDVNHRPDTTRTCKADTPCGGNWFTGQWSKCNATCDKGFRTRNVLCVKALRGDVFAVVGEENCAGSIKPTGADVCLLQPCRPEWYTASWGQCSQSCGTGYRERELKCLSRSQQNSDQCPPDSRPQTRESCNSRTCRETVPDGNRNKGDGNCKDMFSHCRVVRRARLCKFPYYKRMCCNSCS